MDKLVTTDMILDWLYNKVQQKAPISKHTWVDAAMKLVSLMGDEHDKLYELESTVAQMRAELLATDMSVAKAKAIVEASALYKEMRKQQAKISRIEELIRVAKLQARLRGEEERGYQ